MHTYDTALALVGVTVPDHLTGQAEVPILTGPQAQGDLLVVPAPAITDRPGDADGEEIAEGVQLVRGEATGNTHRLHPGFDSPEVRWRHVDVGLVIGLLDVPEGQSALLVHTDEHGANGIGPGRYEIRRKRQLTPPAVPARDRSTRTRWSRSAESLVAD